MSEDVKAPDEGITVFFDSFVIYRLSWWERLRWRWLLRKIRKTEGPAASK